MVALGLELKTERTSVNLHAHAETSDGASSAKRSWPNVCAAHALHGISCRRSAAAVLHCGCHAMCTRSSNVSHLRERMCRCGPL